MSVCVCVCTRTHACVYVCAHPVAGEQQSQENTKLKSYWMVVTGIYGSNMKSALEYADMYQRTKGDLEEKKKDRILPWPKNFCS